MSLSTNTLNTRISLKYDIWENWSKTDVPGKGANLVLKKGEIAFCEIPSGVDNAGVQNPPHIMHKVGNGTSTFSALPWGSAKAADVYNWAKEDLSSFNKRVGDLITDALKGDGVAITGYVTETDFNEFKSQLETWKSGITNSEETGRLDVAEKDITALKGTDTDTKDSVSIVGAKKYADDKDTKLLGEATDNAAYVAGTEGATLDKQTIKGAINIADAALTKAKANSTEIANIKTNISTNIATKDELSQAVTELKGTSTDTKDSETISGAKKYADAAIDTFYNTYIENDSKALDTLKEVTEWLDANKDGAADIISDLNAHTTNKDNPHGVTAAQVGAYTTGQADAKFATLSAFESDKVTVKEATHATSADEASFANEAGRAAQDGSGNIIVDTYETKTNVAAVATRVSTLEGLDEFIIDCGSSTVNVF